MRARVRNGLASLAVDRMLLRNAADASVNGKFEQIRHRIFAPPFHGNGSRNPTTSSEGTLRFRQPTDPEPIDTGSLDDEFLMAFTEDFRVDQPRRWPPAHGALCDSHGLTPDSEGSEKSLPSYKNW